MRGTPIRGSTISGAMSRPPSSAAQASTVIKGYEPLRCHSRLELWWLRRMYRMLRHHPAVHRQALDLLGPRREIPDKPAEGKHFRPAGTTVLPDTSEADIVMDTLPQSDDSYDFFMGDLSLDFSLDL